MDSRPHQKPSNLLNSRRLVDHKMKKLGESKAKQHACKTYWLMILQKFKNRAKKKVQNVISFLLWRLEIQKNLI